MSEPNRRDPKRVAAIVAEPSAERDAGPSQNLLLVLGGGLLASAAVLFFATSSWLVALAFVLGVAVLLGAGLFLDRLRAAPLPDGLAPPDWTVTVAAIEHSGECVAITDRANRLVCANSLFLERFGAAAPPALPFEREGAEALARLARDAWRDGSAALASLAAPDGETEWQISARRAGRGDDHLVWRLRPLVRAASTSLGALDLAGPFGKMLSRAGIETAITTADGVIRAVSAGFAERAAGDERATLMGQDFVSYLRTDERDRIFFAREGRGGTPQTLVDVPLIDPATQSQPLGPDEATSLMLLIDSGVGIGSGFDGAAQAGVAQLDALLGQLPLGLAMTDRDGRFLFGNEAFLRAVTARGVGCPPSRPTLWCARTRPRCPTRCAATGAGLRPAAMSPCGWWGARRNRSASASRVCAGWARRRCCSALPIRARKTSCAVRWRRRPRCRRWASWRAGSRMTSTTC